MNDIVKYNTQNKQIIPTGVGLPKFSIPQLNASPVGFNIPKLTNVFNNSPKNISDLVKQNTSNPPNAASLEKPNFSIPQIFKKSIDIPTIKNEESLNKEPAIGDNNWIIDLKSALIEDKPICEQKKKIENDTTFKPKFIDCENYTANKISNLIEQDRYCEIDVSYVLNVKLKKMRKKSSAFGQILCRKYIHKDLKVKISHDFELKEKITPFDFSTPQNKKN